MKEAGVSNIDADIRHHLIAVEPFKLTKKQIELLNNLGNHILKFYKACNSLYFGSDYTWVSHYLDIGKPDDVIRQTRMKYHKKSVPRIIRPDILIGKDNLVITELDSVPGGMGHLANLSKYYSDKGYQLVGGNDGMVQGFAKILKDVCNNENPVCAIVVSDESSDYLPEMKYLADELRNIDIQAYTIHPSEIIFEDENIYIQTGNGKLKIDITYRFYELFDLLNIPKSELIAYAAKKKSISITPPLKHNLEEKMLLAFIHHPVLKEYWLNNLGAETFEILSKYISPTYILDSRPVPPHSEICGFKWKNMPIQDWKVIKYGSQKERMLVIKPSGFSPLAWGSRGVIVGHDMSQESWADAVDSALNDFTSSPWVLQPFAESETIKIEHYIENSKEIAEMKAKVRLCPYYFVSNDNAELAGVMATACPNNKKIIHGMKSAVISPCIEEND
ncbi:MAG: hypothetical protein SNJ70_08315 [Armatimonadota bacterium]